VSVNVGKVSECSRLHLSMKMNVALLPEKVGMCIWTDGKGDILQKPDYRKRRFWSPQRKLPGYSRSYTG